MLLFPGLFPEYSMHIPANDSVTRSGPPDPPSTLPEDSRRWGQGEHPGLSPAGGREGHWLCPGDRSGRAKHHLLQGLASSHHPPSPLSRLGAPSPCAPAPGPVPSQANSPLSPWAVSLHPSEKQGCRTWTLAVTWAAQGDQLGSFRNAHRCPGPTRTDPVPAL